MQGRVGKAGVWRPAALSANQSCVIQEVHMGSVIKKRRKKIRKHKYRKLRKRTRHQRR